MTTLLALTALITVYEVIDKIQKNDEEEVRKYWEEEDKRFAA